MIASTQKQTKKTSSPKKKKLHLNSHDSAEKSMRKILEQQLQEIKNNIEGVLRDEDIECLHDFRVAFRRSRSALGQLKKVLSKSLSSYYTNEIKWVSDATTPCRDLDVFRGQIEQHQKELSTLHKDQLQPLILDISRRRVRAYQEVVKCLQSDRFKQLTNNWHTLVKYPQHYLPECPNAKVPTKEIANKTILNIYQKMLDSGLGLSEKPAAADMHRLRIKGKKLRYLLEFFRSIYPAERIESLIYELKDFQDIMGNYQDMSVQLEHLDSFSHQHKKMITNDAELDLALAKLKAVIERRQTEYHKQFQAKFKPFASTNSQMEYMSLFGELHY